MKTTTWAVRYSGEFGKSLYSRHADYESAKASYYEFHSRCRALGMTKLADSIDIVKE